MNNVVNLSQRRILADRSHSTTFLGDAIVEIVASNVEMTRNIGRLLGQLDMVEQLVNELPDDDARTKFARLARWNRDQLSIASLELSRQNEKLSALRKLQAYVRASCDQLTRS